MIPFNVPTVTGNEEQYLQQVLHARKMSGDGPFAGRCQGWFEQFLPCAKALMVPSCTHALELAALLLDIKPGDEVIMPSYTFVSTANAFVLRGAKIVFVDIRPDTMNLDASLIEAAITPHTRAIVPVHYAGVSCEMAAIQSLAKKYGLAIVEDAAQGVSSTYQGRQLGTLSDLGAFSFHETKNYTSGGEGGLLVINNPELAKRAEVLREKGTNRSQFLRGMVDKYSWVDIGSSLLTSELQSAFLWGQLERMEDIYANRMQIWTHYHQRLQPLANSGCIGIPFVPADCVHNAHMYYVKGRDLTERTDLISHLKTHGVAAVFHYVPLHSALAGKQFGRFHGDDQFTTRESERLIRLPLWYGMSEADVNHVCTAIESFYR